MKLKLNGYDIKYSLNKTWLLIFRHNSIKGGFLKDEHEASFSLNKNKFSLLSKINESFKVTDNDTYFSYEFLLEYPEFEGFNHWRQELFPSDERTRTQSINYEALSQISWPYRYWGGLALNEHDKQYSFIDGSPLTNTWHFAIGSYTNYYGVDRFPGPCLDLDSLCLNSVSEVYLWMRLDNPQLVEYLPSIIKTCNTRITSNVCSFIYTIHLLLSCS